MSSSSSTFFPTKRRYFDNFHRAMTKWLEHHGLPPTLVQHAQPFLSTQWNCHIQQLHTEPRFTARSITQLQHFLGNQVVLHHADHELQHLLIFCPRIYFRSCLATWQYLNFSHLYTTNKPFHTTKFNLFYGIVHLKAKKHWHKGRAIISHSKSHLAPSSEPHLQQSPP